MGFAVAVFGATGAVGREIVKCLAKRGFPCSNLRLFSSARSAGVEIDFAGEAVRVEELGGESGRAGFDFVFSALDATEAREFVPKARDAGAIVVDNSSAFRMDGGVPLVVPEVNPGDAKTHNGIIANPNCSTIIMIVPVAAIHAVTPVRTIIAATYQAVSGMGKAAAGELEAQIAAYSRGDKAPAPEVFPYRIAFNAIPHVDSFGPGGYTGEEIKMSRETRKILGDDEIRVSATCVRIPVHRAHSEALFISTGKRLTVGEVRVLIKAAPGVRLVDDVERALYPMPLDATGVDDILVGRIREDTALENGIAMWVSGDQLLKGAALNAVQIAELLA